MIELEFAELHSPLFLGGRNLGMKLDGKRYAGIGLSYDRVEKELVVDWNDKQAIVPTSNVVSMWPRYIFHEEHDEYEITAIQEDKEDVLKSAEAPKRGRPPRPTAQVQTPMGHVFMGPGHGKTGKDK